MAETIKLNCRVSEPLDMVVQRAQIRFNGKGKALRKLLDLALADEANDRSAYKKAPPFGAGEATSCTLIISSEDFDRTQPYRERYLLTTKNAFFAFALQHGAVIFDELYPPRAAIGGAARSKAA
ncbi:MAG TPA: hypothetical protein VGW40_03465 [Allosphingosinicella sp.]|nr:hypothetical protein [Allosphingosinicella sp.]